MLTLKPSDWQYLHSGPLFCANIKTELHDFIVREKLSFEPNGEGEHVFLYIEKVGLNTAFVAEELAKFAKLPLRNVSYAGRKDKYARTQQWFGIYLGNKAQPDWNDFELAGLTILTQTKNQKKLRLGTIESNTFEIRLRNITQLDESLLQARIEQIKQHGVPNYFGNQRFGERVKADGTVELGGNLRLAQKLIEGEDIRNRNKRSMAISALRSWLFNQFVSQRLAKNNFALLEGDALILNGSNSFFVHDSSKICVDHENPRYRHIKDRLACQDVLFSAPMWGAGDLDSKLKAFDLENEISQNYPSICSKLSTLGLSQQRRAAFVFPQEISYQRVNADVVLYFSLPSGCFATSVLREIADIQVGIVSSND